MPRGNTIFKRLNQSTKIERREICDILEIERRYINSIDEISKEFRSVSRHTVANTFRHAHALEYITILQDCYPMLKAKGEYEFDASNASENELEKRVEYGDELFNKIKNTNAILLETSRRVETMTYEAKYLQDKNIEPFDYFRELRSMDDNIIIIYH